MSLITGNQLSKSYEPVEIFSGVSFHIPAQSRIAIVGPNGIGKTTLLRILVGEEVPSSGEIQIARNEDVDDEMATASGRSPATIMRAAALLPVT